MKQLFYLIAAFIIATLFLDCIYWTINWLGEKPFNILGWLSLYKMITFSWCHYRTDYAANIILVPLILFGHLLAFLTVFNAIHPIEDIEQEEEQAGISFYYTKEAEQIRKKYNIE